MNRWTDKQSEAVCIPMGSHLYINRYDHMIPVLLCIFEPLEFDQWLAFSAWCLCGACQLTFLHNELLDDDQWLDLSYMVLVWYQVEKQMHLAHPPKHSMIRYHGRSRSCKVVPRVLCILPPTGN